jgi:hypothetical protein
MRIYAIRNWMRIDAIHNWIEQGLHLCVPSAARPARLTRGGAREA